MQALAFVMIANTATTAVARDRYARGSPRNSLVV
jgi:hypothetical protein